MNKADLQEVGEHVSALSNLAALYNQNFGLLIWGINNDTQKIDGTSFAPLSAKYGNQSLDLWIGTQLDPHVQFYFHKTVINGKTLSCLRLLRPILLL